MKQIENFFCCKQCGFCCQGETTISLTIKDQQRMQQYLGLDHDQLAKKYWRRTGHIVQMKTVDGHCVFYRDGCSVHPGRPWRCAQWPLVPALLNSAEDFNIIKESCPGIRPELSYAEFSEALQHYLARRLDEEDFLGSSG